jgi:hypothetical protein
LARPDRKIEAGAFGKRAEIPIARDQENSAVDATLRDQRIASRALRRFASTLARNAPARCLEFGHF